MTDHQTQAPPPKGKRSWLRIVILLLICGGLIAASHWGSEWLISLIDLSSGSGLRSHALHIAMAGIALYSALMGIPFVPGMEISLALLAAFGHQIAMPIYFAIIKIGRAHV